MPERDDFSPTEQSLFKGNTLERVMLRRISRTAFGLPNKFDEKGRAGKIHVHGETSDVHSLIKLDEKLRGDGTVKHTSVTLGRSEHTQLLTSLSTDTYTEGVIEDDMMGLHGVSDREFFILGEESNTLSMFAVMRSVSLAARTVEGALTLRYLATTPEASTLQ